MAEEKDITWEQAAEIAADIVTAGEGSADDFLVRLEREERAKRDKEGDES